MFHELTSCVVSHSSCGFIFVPIFDSIWLDRIFIKFETDFDFCELGRIKYLARMNCSYFEFEGNVLKGIKEYLRKDYPKDHSDQQRIWINMYIHVLVYTVYVVIYLEIRFKASHQTAFRTGQIPMNFMVIRLEISFLIEPRSLVIQGLIN